MTDSLPVAPRPPTRRRWVRPCVRTEVPPEQAMLLMCSGAHDFDCAPIVGYPCCKPNANACNGCQP